jgi:hypothetical protein
VADRVRLECPELVGCELAVAIPVVGLQQESTEQGIQQPVHLDRLRPLLADPNRDGVFDPHVRMALRGSRQE